MLFAIIATDIDQSLALRKANRDAHLARLKLLQEQGRLVLAGPHPVDDQLSESQAPSAFSGSLIVAEFESAEQAWEWANDDPYVHAGIYDNVVIKPFIKVLPN